MTIEQLLQKQIDDLKKETSELKTQVKQMHGAISRLDAMLHKTAKQSQGSYHKTRSTDQRVSHIEHILKNM